MDVMSLRRGLMMAMAGGAQFVKGTFTVPNDSSNYYTLEFGKTFQSYLFLIEMDDASKTALLATGINGNRIYAEQGIFPMPLINNTTPSNMYVFERINPSTQAVSATYGSGGINTVSQTSIKFSCNIVTADQSYLYRGYTYSYYIVEIK